MVQLKVKKPNAVLFDISGTSARESFVEKVLLPYFKVAAKPYLENNWSKSECQEDVKAMMSVAKSDSGAPKIKDEGSKSQQVDSVNKYIEYCTSKGKDSKAFATFRFHVWFDGYDKGKISTPVYSDVAVSIQKWHCDLGIKLYVLSNGWSEATKKFMSKTSHGDLNLLIDGHYDTSIGSLTDPETYKKVTDKIKEKPDDVVFLTKSADEAKAAKKSGLNVVLVLTHRRNVDAVVDSCKDIPIARTFTEIEFI